MSLKVTVDAARFREAIRGLQKQIGRPLKEVTRNEAGSILKTCVGWTKVSTKEQADLRSRGRVTRELGYSGYSNGGQSKSDHPITINSGKKGEVGRVFLLKNDGGGFRRTHNSVFAPVWRHYKDATWRDLQDAIADVKAGWQRAIPAGRAAIGLARQSWVQIADAVGIRLESVPGGGASLAAISKARRAIASDGKAYMNGQATDFERNQSYVIELTNRLPYGRKAGLDGILVRAMNARAKFYATNLAKGVFNTAANTLRAYPGFKVTGGN